MKKFSAVIAVSFFILLCLSTRNAFACTTFCLKGKGEVLFGKNYDWMIGDGLIFVNKRGVVKRATSENAVNPAKWVSRYGSVTFNQYGWENPSGGMNEKGLAIELMWLDDTEYPAEETLPALGTLEWIQYQLDTSSTVAEVIKNAGKVKIASAVKIHYLVNDKEGNSAAIEFIGGKLVARAGEKLEVPALANDTFEKSWNYAKEVKDFGGAREMPQTESSLDRFTRAALKAREFEKQPRAEQEAVDYAFEILRNVAQKFSTQWSIVYDQKRGKIHFRSMRSYDVKTIDAKSFDYSCGSAVKIFDINSREAGDVTAKFIDFAPEKNRELIEKSFSGTPFLKAVPAAAKNALAIYPESFPCEAQQKRAARQSMGFGDYFAAAAEGVRGFFGYLFG